MPTATVSSKGQITLPAELMRAMKLKAGDKLLVELIGDQLVIMPKPASWVDHFVGSMKGTYGKTPEEVDAYVASLRAGPERGQWLDEFWIAYYSDESTKRVVDQLMCEQDFMASAHTLSRKGQVPQLPEGDIENILEKRLNGWVRRLQGEGTVEHFLVTEVVAEIKKRQALAS